MIVAVPPEFFIVILQDSSLFYLGGTNIDKHKGESFLQVCMCLGHREKGGGGVGG